MRRASDSGCVRLRGEGVALVVKFKNPTTEGAGHGE